MSISPGQFIARVVFWRYQRGSWQYDILCGLIILFIFLTPKSVFDGSYFRQDDDVKSSAIEASQENSEAYPEQLEVEKNYPSGS
jgi:hypothetical protein